jgi:hypothetical protein
MVASEQFSFYSIQVEVADFKNTGNVTRFSNLAFF